jgi:preprotein translocase subunit SecE
MARQTRQQRRARRAEQAGSEPTTPLARGPRTGADGTAAVAPPRAEAEPRRPRASRRFVAESWAELKKVDWPGQSQVIQGTVVVLIACLVVGVYLWGVDQVFQRLVEKVLLRP